MEYPKKLILAVLVENKKQEDTIFNSFVQNKSIKNVGNVSAISRDDLFEESYILYNCLGGSLTNKLKDIAKLKDESLEELQSQISNIIDEFIEDLE